MKLTPPPASSFRESSPSGFTLLELLLSMVILSLIIILLAGMGDGASRLWRDGTSRREATREAGAGLQMIGEDLRSAVITSNPATLEITKPPGNGEADGERLFFTSLEPASPSPDDPGSEGDLCLTGYFVAPDPRKGPPFHNLYRFHITGKEATEAFAQDRLAQVYATASPGNPYTELLARNILRLEVKPLFPGRHGEPGVLMITLRAVGEETARQLSSGPLSAPGNEALLRRHLQSHTTLVRLPPRREMHTAE